MQSFRTWQLLYTHLFWGKFGGPFGVNGPSYGPQRYQEGVECLLAKFDVKWFEKFQGCPSSQGYLNEVQDRVQTHVNCFAKYYTQNARKPV